MFSCGRKCQAFWAVQIGTPAAVTMEMESFVSRFLRTTLFLVTATHEIHGTCDSVTFYFLKKKSSLISAGREFYKI